MSEPTVPTTIQDPELYKAGYHEAEAKEGKLMNLALDIGRSLNNRVLRACDRGTYNEDFTQNYCAGVRDAVRDARHR